MAMDLTWILTAKDNASTVFDKVKASGTGAAEGVQSAFGGVLNKFNLVTGAVGTMAALAAGGVFSKIIQETVAWTGEAVALSKSLGITTEQASMLNVALGDVYLSKETMLAGSQRITKTLSTEEDAFKRLGVATRDQSGHYRSTLDIMTDVNTKLLTIKEGTDRNIAMMSIYGRGWGELTGLLRLNSKAMDEAAKKAKELGLLVGDEGVRQSKAYKAALNDIEDVAKSLTVQFGNVLLPHLIKVGAFLGNNGPLLANAFDWSLKALGKTVYTLGSTLGFLAAEAVSVGSVIGKVFSGDFSGAKAELRSMLDQTKAFGTDMKKTWTDWSSKSITSKVVIGDQLPTDFGVDKESQANKEEAALKKRLDLWKDNARKILDVEKDRTTEQIRLDKEYLSEFTKVMDERIASLDKFRASYTSVLDSIAARDKTLADERNADLRANEDSYSRYYRQRAELATATQKILDNPGWTSESAAKEIQMLNDQITVAKTYRDEVRAGKVDLISKEQAEQDFLITKQSLEEKIKAIGEEQIKTQTAAAEKAAEAVVIMDNTLKLQEAHLKTIDDMIKNIPDITEKELRIKITGLDDLYKVQALAGGTGSSSSGTTATVTSGQVSSVSSLKLGDPFLGKMAIGTNYVPADGYAYLHQGEAVVPRAYNPAAGGSTGGSSISIGDITITLPNVTNQSSADSLARSLVPALRKYMGRSLAMV